MSKKIILLTAIIVGVLFSSFDAKADPCPAGSFEVTVADNGFPGCPNMEVTFCVGCNVTNPSMIVTIKSMSGVCNPKELPEYMDYVTVFILANYATYCPTAWTPCTEGTKELVVLYPLCFYEDDEQWGVFRFCNASYCKKTYEVCTDANGEVIHTLISTEIIGSLGCAFDVWHPNLEPGKCFKTEECP